MCRKNLEEVHLPQSTVKSEGCERCISTLSAPNLMLLGDRTLKPDGLRQSPGKTEQLEAGGTLSQREATETGNSLGISLLPISWAWSRRHRVDLCNWAKKLQWAAPGTGGSDGKPEGAGLQFG